MNLFHTRWVYAFLLYLIDSKGESQGRNWRMRWAMGDMVDTSRLHVTKGGRGIGIGIGIGHE